MHLRIIFEKADRDVANDLLQPLIAIQSEKKVER